MLTAWVVKTTIKGKVAIQLNLQPVVITHDRRAGGPWRVAASGADAARKLCEELAKSLINKDRAAN
jgi:hypothetical protein